MGVYTRSVTSRGRQWVWWTFSTLLHGNLILDLSNTAVGVGDTPLFSSQYTLYKPGFVEANIDVFTVMPTTLYSSKSWKRGFQSVTTVTGAHGTIKANRPVVTVVVDTPIEKGMSNVVVICPVYDGKFRYIGVLFVLFFTT
jgi:hypothetical protein